tara:strand:+ start:1540 stop:1764 length:225 start_codon:yes stop_codon:yes gene_type:complete
MTTNSRDDKFFETAGMDFIIGETPDEFMPLKIATDAGRIAFSAGVPIEDNPENDEQMRECWREGWGAASILAEM